jgi:hypothetical protein
LASVLSCMTFISAGRRSSICFIFIVCNAIFNPIIDQSNPTSDTSCHVFSVTIDGVWFGDRICWTF